jgi:predicted PurR-regulated permease PerM
MFGVVGLFLAVPVAGAIVAAVLVYKRQSEAEVTAPAQP